ncbi:MAG TPA: type VI secretion system tube protein Hcp [Candidatus Acidoferrales bacterium]|nr:type VI secretion system tube protein Hcp [Candidatus Acidoferrales bacterium]
MTQKQVALGLRTLGIASAILVAAGLFTCGTANAQTQTTAYVRIVTSHGPVAGEATDPGHQGWIACREASMPSVSEITATNQAVAASSPTPRDAASGQATGKRMHEPVTISKEAVAAQPGGSAPRDAATGQASGKRRWEPIKIMKEVDKASPILFRLASSGEMLPEVDIALYHDEGGKMVPAATYKLTDVVVSSVQKMSSGGDRPMESVSFTYQKIEITH